jgi:hypothetical protein
VGHTIGPRRVEATWAGGRAGRRPGWVVAPVMAAGDGKRGWARS